MTARRVCILGPAGSGKTTLAQRLAVERGLAHHELDSVFWNDASSFYGTRRDPVNRDLRLSALAAGDAWVLEGVFYTWCGPAFERAEEIWVLDAPLWVRQWRLLRRHLFRRLWRERGLKRTDWRSTLELMAWDRAWDRNNRPGLLRALEPFVEKVRRAP